MRAGTFSVGTDNALTFKVDQEGAIAVLPSRDGTVPVIGGQTTLSTKPDLPTDWSSAQEATGNNESISDGTELYNGAGFGDPLLQGQLADALWGLQGAGDRGRLLEVGCGPGFLLRDLEHALPRWICEGVDPSTESVNEARKRGVKCALGTLQSGVVTPGVDALVIMGNFQLHPDPRDTLRQAASLANDGARLFLDTKNPLSGARRLARRLMMTPILNKLPPVNAFAAHSLHGLRVAPTKRQLVSMLEDEGWEVLETRTVPPRLLRFENAVGFARGPVKWLWLAIDYVDRLLDERAWIQVRARRAG